jgi:hypothetical protein
VSTERPIGSNHSMLAPSPIDVTSKLADDAARHFFHSYSHTASGHLASPNVVELVECPHLASKSIRHHWD